MFTKRAAFVLALVLACAFLISVAAQADVQYIFPESNTRELTWDEVEAWNNEALHIGFNEIWARYGYKFIPGGACDRWFSQQEWYHPITSGTNEKNVLPKASKLEWKNYQLIKDVMAYKRAYDLENEGKKLPMPPQSFELLSGFQYVALKTGQTLAVYSAPSATSWRGANGKASVSTNGRVYAFGRENNWLMVMYETNASENAVRVGWIDLSKLNGSKADLPGAAGFNNIKMTLDRSVNVTDDPVGMTSMTGLSEGTRVTWLATFYSNSHMWDYIEFNLNGQRARGFVLSGALQTEITDTDDWKDDNG